ncbi:hypothetical protein BJ165DRAFT_1594724 [Panaeolus papilionaceus]|nr:hypothetical protein BJ165DRAFT_1594724 [Panaeolus papilionaceus]
MGPTGAAKSSFIEVLGLNSAEKIAIQVRSQSDAMIQAQRVGREILCLEDTPTQGVEGLYQGLHMKTAKGFLSQGVTFLVKGRLAVIIFEESESLDKGRDQDGYQYRENTDYPSSEEGMSF